MKSSVLRNIIFILPLLFFGCNVWNWINGPDEPSDISVFMDKNRYSAADTILVTCNNGSDQPIYLEGCNVFYLNTASDTGWVVTPMHVCVWEGYAKKIEPGKRYTETYFSGSLHKGVYRFTVPVYGACVDNKPISQAECRSREILIGPVFTVVQ